MSFDQVRKILKERNVRGTMKLTVRTYESIDENSLTEKSSRNNCQSPVYTFLPYTPPSPLKPLRSTNSSEPVNHFFSLFLSLISLGDDILSKRITHSNGIFLLSICSHCTACHQSVHLQTCSHNSSPIEAFRQMLEPCRSHQVVLRNAKDLEFFFLEYPMIKNYKN